MALATIPLLFRSIGPLVIEIAGLETEGFGAAWREFVRNADPKLSLCDAASFVIMRERGLRRAFTLDRHFEAAGFEILP